jgi:hypothetical protein
LNGIKLAYDRPNYWRNTITGIIRVLIWRETEIRPAQVYVQDKKTELQQKNMTASVLPPPHLFCL